MPTAPDDVLKGIVSRSEYRDVTVYTVNERNEIECGCGILVPQYSEDDVRRKYNGSVSYSKDGRMLSVSLEERTDVDTPLGHMTAEFLTFHDTGEIKRVFPVNGRISGYWSEQDERELCPVTDFDFPFSRFKARIINVCFYRSGSVRSLTLWPGEIIEIDSPCGRLHVKNGFSLYENGKMRSLEPANPVRVMTPIGEMTAFDPMALGINADRGSLVFDTDGNVISMRTVSDRVMVESSGSALTMSPRIERSMTSDDEWVTVPMRMDFTADGILFDGNGPYAPDACTFSVERYRAPTVISGPLIVPK